MLGFWSAARTALNKIITVRFLISSSYGCVDIQISCYIKAETHLRVDKLIFRILHFWSERIVKTEEGIINAARLDIQKNIQLIDRLVIHFHINIPVIFIGSIHV